MAPVSGSGRRGRGASRGAPGRSRGRWRPQPENQDRGSAREGQGFALRRKQKIEQDYKKLLRKQSKVNRAQTIQYTENYPEHLKHLYLAEEEMLKQQQQRPRKNEGHEKESQKMTEQKDNTVAKVSTTNQPRFKKKTANQKAREDYEKIKAERAKKKEEALKRKQEREEAQRLYKQRKMESYKILSKKTKKGQPNLNLQMEYLLQKIQQNT